ncbi:hypothetical protein Tco_0501223, partial [Tanacetum coccineum]
KEVGFNGCSSLKSGNATYMQSDLNKGDVIASVNVSTTLDKTTTDHDVDGTKVGNVDPNIGTILINITDFPTTDPNNKDGVVPSATVASGINNDTQYENLGQC